MSPRHTKRKHKLYAAGATVCPLCLAPMRESDATLEDVPSTKIGGDGIHLTCKTCNNSAGTYLDNAAIIDATGRLRATVTRPDGHSLNAVLNFAEPQPKLVRDPKSASQPLPPSSEPVNELQATFTAPKPELMAAGLLRSAYLAVLAMLGYTPMKNDAFELVRQQIRHPDPMRIPYSCSLTGNTEPGIYAAVQDNRVFWLIGFSTPPGPKWVQLPSSPNDVTFYDTARTKPAGAVAAIRITGKFLPFGRRLAYLGIPATDLLRDWSVRIRWLQAAASPRSGPRPQLRLVSLEPGQHGAARLLMDGREVGYELRIVPDDAGSGTKVLLTVEGKTYTHQNADIKVLTSTSVLAELLARSP